MFHNLLGIRLRLALVAKGIPFWDRQAAMANYSPDLLPIAEQMSGQTVPAGLVQEGVGAIGDGTLIQKIIEFLSSPAGQQLIAALISLLVAL